MTDYGHELWFGSFVTPAARPPQAPVELALTSERAGLDFVSFQDHPYQSAFQDTWTLMSYVAARTERVRISGNVLSLPLRPPAMLARAAASLDRLTGRRVDARPERAAVVIRRARIGPVSNDIGFARQPDGSFEAIISEYDRRRHDPAWLTPCLADPARPVLRPRRHPALRGRTRLRGRHRRTPAGRHP
ncbi:LLM class flavin-dependent oxidoreductase [Streptomyces sp. CMB-StM0423]|uniref:LLM class flavin-dependent oxidoreductase n=1 Tax=Streptomyces sp. CMB-StM0423 TaxID=2059884 RepID=UPI001F34B8E8|nr:LLM class flavin-dependent oxidoreductase [Streptomyces sp. CMB-StM0423]